MSKVEARHSPETYSSIPLALILQLEHPEPKLAKYILSCQEISQPLPNKKYKPSHVVLLLRYHNHHEYSYSRVALLELNNIGIELHCGNDKKLKSGRLIRILDGNGQERGLFADEGSVNETHRVVISEWNEKEMIFSQSIDVPSSQFLKFKLNQKKVEESVVEIAEMKVLNSEHPKMYHSNQFLGSLVLGNSVNSSNIVLPHAGYDPRSKQQKLALFDIVKRQKELGNNQFDEFLKVSEKYSIGEFSYGFDYAALMENKLGQRFILTHSNFKTKHSSIARLTLKESKLFTYRTIEVFNFDRIFQENIYKTNCILSHTPLSEGKYLFMTYSKGKKPSTTFQHYFTNEIVWILVDVNERRTKRVYPRVYDIASAPLSNQITKETSDEQQQENSFETVRKNKRGGKIQKKHFTEDHLYLDGDLNGGYSDASLLQKLKRVSNSNIEPSSVMIQILKEDLIHENVTMKAFRPYFSNPDIFQILVFFNKHLAKEAGIDFNPHYGKMFSFYFKFRDETKVKVRKVGRRFSDVEIITCSSSTGRKLLF